MKTKLNSIFLLVTLALISLACGGGSGSDDVSSQSSTIRVKGLSAGDVLKAYTLDGTMVDSSSASSSGDGAVSLSSTAYSVRVVLEVDGVALFETLVTTDELVSGNVTATLNAASTIMSQQLTGSFSTIYSAEYAAVMAASQSNDSSTDSSSDSSVTDLIASLPSAQKSFTATVSTASSANLGYSVGDTVQVALSGSGFLFLDSQSVAAGYQNSDPSYANTIFWDGPSPVVYQVYISNSTLYYFSASNSGDDNDYVSFSIPDFSGSQAKARAGAGSTSLSSTLSSMFGVTKITDLSLSEAAALSQVSSYLAEIEMYTYLSAMALRVADEGTLSSSGWAAILTAVDTALASGSSANAKALADLIQSYLTPTTAITTSDFGTEMLAFLGSSDTVADKLTALQIGDTVGTLSLIVGATGEMSSATALSSAEAALVSENVLEAYEYAALAVSLDPSNEQARLVSALTRMITVGVKNNTKVKAFQQAANLEYTFIGNDALEARLDSDEPEAGTVYDDADTVTGLPTLAEINTFVQDVYYSDIMDSIADLEAIDLTSFTGYTLTVAMQGYDEEDMSYNASSDVDFDDLDVKALLASMYLLKSKTESYLAHNLSVSGVNDSQAAMLDLAEDALNDEPKVTGTATMAMTWDLESGSAITGDSLVNGSLSLKGGFPGQILVTNFSGDDGDPLEFTVYPWDDGDQYWQVTNHAAIFDSSSNGGVTFLYAFDGEITRGGNDYFFEGGMVDINGEWRWTIVVNNSTTYHVISTPSGSLAKSSTQAEITDATAQSWINNNSSFLTTTDTYVTKSRTSLVEAADLYSDLIDEFQLLDAMNPSEARENNLVATEDVEFEFDNMVPMTDTEINDFQSFVGDLVDALSGPATVDPTFMSSDMEATSINLSVISQNTRAYMTNSSDQAIMVDGALEADEDEIEAELAQTISSDNLFGMTSGVIYGGNVSDLYGDLGDYVDDWLSNGSVSFSRSYYTTVLGFDASTLPGVYRITYNSDPVEYGDFTINSNGTASVLWDDSTTDSLSWTVNSFGQLVFSGTLADVMTLTSGTQSSGDLSIFVDDGDGSPTETVTGTISDEIQ